MAQHYDTSFIDTLKVNAFFNVADSPVKGSWWYDKEGKPTDDPAKMVRKEAEAMPRFKSASTPEEFNQIYDREFKKNGMEDKPDNHRIFHEALKKYIRELIDHHASRRSYETTDFKIISTAESFLNWLNPNMIANPQPITEITTAVNARIIDKLPYDIHQHRLFSFDDAILIHYHYNDGEDLEAYQKTVFSHENIQLAIKFEKAFKAADKLIVISLLDEQFDLGAARDVPGNYWLDNVEKIIAHHGLLKRTEYAKHDAVKLWFKEKREEIKQSALPEVPYIGVLFHNNFNISDLVIDAYYRLVQQPKSHGEVSKSFVGRTHRYNEPYFKNLYGAYINMDTWGLLQLYRQKKYEPYDQVTDEEIDAGLQRYATGFKDGYHQFEKELLGNNPFQDNANKAQLIFDFATSCFGGMHGMPTSYGEGVHFFDGWEREGFDEGKLYRAWYLMLENSSLFAGLFESRITKHATPDLKIDQIALLYVFEQKIITRKNGDEIAASFGHTSGEKLFQRFTFYSNHTNRTFEEATAIKLSNKIKLFESIVTHLPAEHQPKITAEIKALKNLLATVWAK